MSPLSLSISVLSDVSMTLCIILCCILLFYIILCEAVLLLDLPSFLSVLFHYMYLISLYLTNIFIFFVHSLFDVLWNCKHSMFCPVLNSFFLHHSVLLFLFEVYCSILGGSSVLLLSVPFLTVLGSVYVCFLLW